MKNTIKILTAFLFLVTHSHAQCFSKLSLVYAHVNAQKTDGTFWGWGTNTLGSLGFADLLDVYVPTQIPNSGDWQSVYSGRFNSFAIKSNGTLWGTGHNLYGCLGVGSTAEVIVPYAQIGTATNWKQVAGNYYTIGLKTDGTIWGWGQNVGYEMGDGTCCDDRLFPGQIGTDTDWKQIGATIARAAFALKENGTLWCWGTNIAGLLGDNLVTARPFPTQHNPENDWDHIEVGKAHVLMLKTNGTLWSWGSGGTGATGDGLSPSFNRYLPRQIGSDNTWTVVSAGDNFSMGIKADGTLWGWGSNDVNQLGDGSGINRFLPVQVGTDTNWQTVTCGYLNAAAIKTDGSLWTWGSNDYGQLGNGTITPESTPTYLPVTGCTLTTEDFASQINNLQLSPNPASSQLTLSYKGSQTVNAIVIYDFLGREVYSRQPVAGQSFSATIPVSQFKEGGYLLVLQNNGQTVVSKKWMKQ